MSQGLAEPWVRLFRWVGFCVGYLATYFLSTAIPTPLLWYYPVNRMFVFAVHPSGLAMDYYGRILLSLVGGAVGWGLAAVGVRERTKIERALPALVAWMACLVLFTAGLYLYLLTHRDPVPVPLPPGYVAR